MAEQDNQAQGQAAGEKTTSQGEAQDTGSSNQTRQDEKAAQDIKEDEKTGEGTGARAGEYS